MKSWIYIEKYLCENVEQFLRELSRVRQNVQDGIAITRKDFQAERLKHISNFSSSNERQTKS